MYSAINHIMKQMIMNMRQETVEEYLKRGGTVTKIPEVLDTIGYWWGYQERYQAESLKDGTQQVVSWKSIQPDERFDTEDDDRKYWNKLNKKCDQLLKKMKRTSWKNEENGMIPKVHNGNTSKRMKEKKRKTEKNLTLLVRFDII